MSKQYFAKWIATGGEIKEGDFYSCPHKGHALKIPGKPLAHEPKMIICKNTVGGGVICPDCYKIKLFLCSRNIEVGDEVYHINNSEFIYGIVQKILPDGVKIRLGITGYALCEPSEVYKVIGEISPNAGWIKENMEFSEDEWALYGKTKDIVGLSKCFKGREYLEGYKKHYEKLVCKISCPTCNTFH